MNKKSSKIMVIFSLVGIIASVISLIYSAVIENIYKSEGGAYPLAFIVLVVSVLFLASITTKKEKLTKILSIILSSLMVLVNFILAIVKYSELLAYGSRPVVSTVASFIYFGISILMLVASVFGLIYFISSFKSEQSLSYLKISIIVLSSLILTYNIIYFVFTIYNGVVLNELAKVDTILILTSYSMISTFPLLVLNK